jgi:hypothetical protein
MSRLLESPWPILIGGATVEVLLVVALVRSGRGSLLAAIAGVGVLTGALVVVERMIVTETERVEITLDELSAALVRNNLEETLDFIAASAGEVRDLAKSTLPLVSISEAHVGSDLSITLDERAQPPTALASFTGRFQLKALRGSVPYENMIRRFRIKFEKQEKRWLIVAVAEENPVKR